MRLFDRLLSVVAALLLVALGAGVAAEIVHTLLGQPGHLLLPWENLARSAREQSWSDPVVLAISGAVAVIGLALLLAETIRRRPALLTLAPRTDGVISGVRRTSVRRALAAQADDIDGIRSASAKLRRRRADVTAVTVLRDPGDLHSRVDTAVTGWVQRLDLVATPAVRVRLKQRTPR